MYFKLSFYLIIYFFIAVFETFGWPRRVSNFCRPPYRKRASYEETTEEVVEQSLWHYHKILKQNVLSINCCVIKQVNAYIDLIFVCFSFFDRIGAIFNVISFIVSCNIQWFLLMTTELVAKRNYAERQTTVSKTHQRKRLYRYED